uniref:Sodium-dependent serotonin transporter n=1 Tax=Panagrolaimus sp. JU765 TaxID=591449 RepID=A0AC34PVQ2_9BILA
MLEVPWKTCNNDWNTNACRDHLADISYSTNGTTYRTPAEEYYNNRLLEINKSTGFDDLKGIKPSLAFCLFLVFLTVYFALWKGPRSSGKVVWVTATAPYFILTILLIRGITLPGASKGIYYYLVPDFDKLYDPNVWTAAATQIFFSLGPGFGVLLALSSYNDFNNNCYRDACVTSIINCFTSIFSGFVIFSTLGYMSELTNKPVPEVVGDSENSLIFVVYPQAIATMKYPGVWAVIFFIMLITLGIDSTFSGIEALITGFCDEYPRFLLRKREIFVGIVIFIYFLGSLPTVTYGGSYVIPFLDEYGVSLSVLFIVMCEMIAVCWFYGIRRFSEDIRLMLGFYPGLYWRICWMCCPVFIGLIFGMAVWNTSLQPYQLPGYTYPKWSVYLGWFIRMTSVLSVPIYIVYKFIATSGSFKQ